MKRTIKILTLLSVVVGLMINPIMTMPTMASTVSVSTVETSLNNLPQLSEDWEKVILNSNKEVTKYCNVNKLNVRKYPSTSAPILSQFRLNTSALIIAEFDGWSCIETCDGIAFIKSEYMSNEETKRTYTDEDLNVLAHLLSGECQTYPDLEQRYVGSVVLNRVKSKKYPNTIKDVVFQKGQYSCTRDGNYYRTPTQRNWDNARWLLENGSILPNNIFYQSGSPLGKIYIKTNYHYYCY